MPFRYLRGHPGGDATAERLGALVPRVGRDATPDAIRHAIRCGATHFVAAPGKAARALGAGLAEGWAGRAAVILHLAPPADLARGRIADWTECALLGACRDLGTARLHTVVVPAPAGGRGSALLDRLIRARGEGLLGHVGVAVTSAAAARLWLKRREVGHVELAVGGRDDARGLAAALAARHDVMMVARGPLARCRRQAWAQAVVVPLSTGAAWSGLIDAARATHSRSVFR
jgi:hypothetical protein